MTRRSPVWPLAGTVLVWVWYGLSTTFQGAPDERAAVPATSSVLSPNKKPATPAAQPRAVETGTSKRSAEMPEGAATPAAPAPADAPPLSPDDEALLAALDDATTDEARIARLGEFVWSHPNHVLARTLLASALLRGEADAVELRPHIEALLGLMPDSGVPHLLLASLELRESRDDLARRCLEQAAAKDLAWSPDSALLQLKLQRERARGTPPIEALVKVMGTNISFCPLARDLAEQLLPHLSAEREDAAATRDPAMQRAAARALFDTGAGLQSAGIPLIENLVGHALLTRSAPVLRATGDLGPEDERLLAHGQTMRTLFRMLRETSPQWTQQAFLPAPRFFADMAAYGELRAMLRASMDYLAEQGAPRDAEPAR